MSEGTRYRWAGLLLLVFLVIFFGPLRSSLSTDRGTAALTGLAVAVVAITLHVRLGARSGPSLGLIYTVVFSLFHLGLFMPTTIGLEHELLNAGDEKWAQASTAGEALAAVVSGLCALNAAYFLAARKPPAGPAPPLRTGEFSGVGTVGLVALITGIALWLAIVPTSGVTIIGGSYTSFLEASSAIATIPVAYLLIGLGLPLAAAGSRTTRASGLAVFVLWALPAFFLGLRGEVLLPLAAYTVVAGRQGVIRLRWWHALAFLIILAAGAWVKSVRGLGLGTADWSMASLSPTAGIVEMGYSIRPAIMVLQWQQLGDPHVGPGVYTGPFHRAWGTLTGTRAEAAGIDPTILSTVVDERVGPIGGSVVAEAIRSFGLTGVVAVLALIGLVMAVLDGAARSDLLDAGCGGAAFILLLWVRNDFAPVPAQVVLLGFLILAAYLLSPSKPEKVPVAGPAREPSSRVSGGKA